MRIKKDIMKGNGLPDIAHTSEIGTALCTAGFELVESRDLAFDSDPETPWYRALQGRDLSLASVPRTPLGRALMNLGIAGWGEGAHRSRRGPRGQQHIERRG